MKRKAPKPTMGEQYQLLLDKRDRAEAKHVRAFNAWRLLCLDVKRMEKRLDREQEERNKIGGEADVRLLSDPLPQPEPAPTPPPKKRTRKPKQAMAPAV